MSTRKSTELLTPGELYNKYKDRVLRHNWTPEKIGTFFLCGLVDGYFCGSEKRNLITESSFLRLLALADKIKEMHVPDVDELEGVILLTATQLYTNHQHCTRHNWNASNIGIFYFANLLLGGYSRKRKCNLIVEQTFLELLRLADRDRCNIY